MSRISIEADGFTLTSDSGEAIATVEWSEVDRIEGFLSDFVSEDQICLEFFCGEKTVMVTEDDQGFEDLAPALIANLDLEDPNWFGEVMGRQLLPRRKLIYDREEGY
jgi:hypothetical protein